MATKGSSSVPWILVHGYDIAQTCNEVSYGQTAMTEQTQCFTDTWVENSYVGIKEHTIMLKGFYDVDSNGSDDAFRSAIGSNRVFCMALEGNTQGLPFDGLEGPVAQSYNRLVSHGEFTKFDTEFAAFGAMETGVILSTLAAKTSSSNSTAVNNGGSSLNGGGAYVQVTAMSGFTSVTIKVQHSPNGSSWSDLATFTAVTAAPTAEFVAVAAGTTVNQHLRALWTVTGSGSITFFVGFARR